MLSSLADTWGLLAIYYIYVYIRFDMVLHTVMILGYEPCCPGQERKWASTVSKSHLDSGSCKIVLPRPRTCRSSRQFLSPRCPMPLWLPRRHVQRVQRCLSQLSLHVSVLFFRFSRGLELSCSASWSTESTEQGVRSTGTLSNHQASAKTLVWWLAETCFGDGNLL